LLGLAVGNAVAVPPGEALGDGLVLSRILAEELLTPDVDLRRLAHRWAALARRSSHGLDGWTRTSLQHILVHDSPPASADTGAGAEVLARGLPVALATFRTPASLSSATYHIAMLTHPDERCGWGAVAINVAAARFLSGSRDFLPDVIEALRNNDAPQPLLAAARRVPLVRREDLPRPVAGLGGIVPAVETALWFAWHEPSFERALGSLGAAGGYLGGVGAVVGGLLGARDGDRAIPAGWLAGVVDAGGLGRLAERLLGLESAAR
jgi:ADP-ribosylglycohydrolase